MRPLGLISISVRAMRVADFILKVSASLGVIAMSLAPWFMLWFVAQSEPDSASVVMACVLFGGIQLLLLPLVIALVYVLWVD